MAGSRDSCLSHKTSLVIQQCWVGQVLADVGLCLQIAEALLHTGDAAGSWMMCSHFEGIRRRKRVEQGVPRGLHPMGSSNRNVHASPFLHLLDQVAQGV